MEKAKTRKKSAGSTGKAKFETAEDFQRAANAYFDRCDAEGQLYGEAGLALALGVTLHTLQEWYDGDRRKELQKDVQMAYLRIQNQIETDPRYQEKSMVSRGIFLNKQIRLGGYQDKTEARQEIAVNVKMGPGMDASDFR